MMRFASLLSFLVFAGEVAAQGKGLPMRPEQIRNTLPTDHPYQKVLRKHLETLTEKDFDHGVAGKMTAAEVDDPEQQYRSYLLTLTQQPLVGTKRGVPAVNAPAKLFVLTSIEKPEGVHTPPVFPEPLIALTQWKYPGNPYYDNRALKLRAFVRCVIQMTMLDDQLENHPERGGSRADWFGNQLIILAQPYPGFKSELPVEVQKAYETGLRRMGQRVPEWGPEGEEPNLDIIAAVGLWYVSQAIQDPTFTKEAEAYARMLFTDPRYFHPAGFFLDNRGIDMGYQGMTNYFATGAALASNWSFAKEAVERCYRLRAHLCLPEPDGSLIGPSHFNSRTSSDASDDQWQWGHMRDTAASLLTNEAAYLAKTLEPAELSKAPAKQAGAFGHQIAENPIGKGGYIKNDQIGNGLWAWRLWQSFNFPATMNFGYEHYPAGAYAKRHALEKENSPWLKSPFLRDENFVRAFDKAFTVARQPSFAAIVHSGPVGEQIPDGHFKFAGPLGFGGGQLSAFWTPATGSVILGRRGGNSWNKTFDLVEEWRTWPIHALSGAKLDGKVFTTARILNPEVLSEVKGNSGRVQVSGIIPVEELGQGKVLEGRLSYQRIFKLDGGQVHVETKLQSTGQDKVAELYETVPVFLHTNAKVPATEVLFQINDKWAPATPDFTQGVTAVKLKRLKGAVEITFDEPQRVKLGAVWADTYLSRAKCQNLLIDLLGGTSPVVLKGERKVGYRVAAAAN